MQVGKLFSLVPLLCLMSTVAGCQPDSASLSATQEEIEQQDVRKKQQVEPREAPLPKGTLSPEETSAGWISLFDGHSLFGWHATSDADWRVEDGAIVVSEGEKGLLCTSVPFADYELRLQFNAEPTTNSGVFLHTSAQPQDPKVDCYELNIAPADNPFPTGSFVGRQKVADDTTGEGWRTFEAILNGDHALVKLDGQQVLDYTDPAPLRRGLIGLQLNEGRVAFRNIQIRPLNLEPIFDGKSLEGWKEYPDMASRFSVTPEGWLNVTNGRGQLETEQSYGDFILQFACMTHERGLNSGVFFRCIPGEQMNGYECQIHNGYQNGDRSQPVDAGTGAIFRRQPARVVAANDLEWFWVTIVATGPKTSTWVNGLQVVDYTDERAPHENPRNGLRLEPGTIMLQGHDPTTNVSFRDLRIGLLDEGGGRD